MKPNFLITLKCLVWAILILFMLMKQSFGQATANVAAYETSFSYDPILSPWPVIKISINGNKPLPFVLDTGSDSLYIEPWAADATGLKRYRNKSGHEEVTIEKARLDLIGSEPAIAILNIEAMYVRQFDIGKTPAGEQLAGIIGATLLHSVGIRLDYVRKVLTMYTDDVPAAAKSAFLVPLVPAHDPKDERVFVETTIDSKNILVLLDTGAPYTILRRQDVTNGSIKRESDIRIKARWVDGLFSINFAQLKGIQIAALNVSDLGVCVVKDKEGPPPLIGNNLLASYIVTIDRRQMRMWLEPQTPKPATQVPGGLALQFDSKPNGTFITDLLEPALSSGLRSKDRIVAIDGHPVRQEDNPVVVERRINGLAGTTAVIEVERDQKNLTYRFRRQSIFDPMTTLGVGITPRLDESSGRLYVEQVDAGAGKSVRVGDEIVKINGIAVLGKKREELSPLFRQPRGSHIVVVLRRHGNTKLKTVVLAIRSITVQWSSRRGKF